MFFSQRILLALLFLFFGEFSFLACNSGSEADQRGVGSECSVDEDCTEEGQACLTFKGGYCGIEDCTEDADCPEGSRCVDHTDSTSYCFLVCEDKPDCNTNRSEENESNCSANIVFSEEPQEGVKACVPPSSDPVI